MPAAATALASAVVLGAACSHMSSEAVPATSEPTSRGAVADSGGIQRSPIGAPRDGSGGAGTTVAIASDGARAADGSVGATNGTDAKNPRVWLRAAAIDGLAASCKWTPGADDFNDDATASLCQEGLFEQACVYDPCLEARQKCTPKCATSCDACASGCVSDCASCESACADDACRRGCATETATCRDRCMTSRQTCLDTTCEDARRACSAKVDAEWSAKGCAKPCAALTACQAACYDRNGGDAACIKRCEATFLGKCSRTMMNVCTSGAAPQ